ncbi:MAG: O-methyltransferase [Pseudomonadota bacterium]|nr:O-methyltransferase [Pseudomonadota bacterium]
MEKELSQNDPRITAYFEDLLVPEDKILEEVRIMGIEAGLPQIQVGKHDARHLEVLTRSFNASSAVEIGTLGGYSGISIVRGLQKNGKLFTFEMSEKHASVARKAFVRAGISENVEIFLGPALDNLSKIETRAPFDLVFIDADKGNYCKYFQWAKKVLRVGGVILADNTFAWGQVFDRNTNDETVKALQKYNDMAARDPEFRTTIIPTCEGLTMSVRI